MKIVKITPTQAREWRLNQPKIVEADGLTIVRGVTEQEIRILAELEKRAKHTREGQLYVEKEGHPDEKRIEVELVEVNPTVTAMKKTISGKAIVGGREHFKRWIFEKHGECQMRNFTGRMMGAVRDPKKVRPTVGVPLNTPHPEVCVCRDWAGADGLPHPGRHHRVCEWNGKAPLEERALDGGGIVVDRPAPDGAGPAALPRQSIDPTGDFRPSGKVLAPGTGTPSMPMGMPMGMASSVVEPLLGATVLPVSLPVPPPAKRVVTPENATDDEIPKPRTCTCKDWVLRDGTPRPEGVHHPVCQWKERFEKVVAIASGTVDSVLVDLDTKEVLRPATIEETREASGEKGYCVVGGKPYGVLPASEVHGGHDQGSVIREQKVAS